jgi:flagella basal body P-ring formation protein FlgA
VVGVAVAVLLSGVASAALPEVAVRDAVARRVGVPVADVEVGSLGLLPSAAVDAAWIVDFAPSSTFTGSTTLTLRNGDVRYVVRPRIVIWRDVPVAAEAVAPGQPLTLVTARVSSDRLRGETPVDPVLTWDATVSFAAGDPVTINRARPQPDLREGAAVRIESGAGSLSVSAPGELLSDAQVGQRVAVLNLATRAVQHGVYRGGTIVALEAP